MLASMQKLEFMHGCDCRNACDGMSILLEGVEYDLASP